MSTLEKPTSNRAKTYFNHYGKEEHGHGGSADGHAGVADKAYEQHAENQNLRQHEAIDFEEGLGEYSDPITPEELEEATDRWLEESYRGMEEGDDRDVYANGGSTNAEIEDLLSRFKPLYEHWVMIVSAINKLDSAGQPVTPVLQKAREDAETELEGIEDKLRALMQREDVQWTEAEVGAQASSRAMKRKIDARAALIDHNPDDETDYDADEDAMHVRTHR